jgi:hypothetical protein
VSRFTAVISVPGEMTTEETLPTFDTAQEAWAYLAKERREAEDERSVYVDGLPCEEYSSAVDVLDYLASDDGQAVYGDPLALQVIGADGTGVIVAPTPGYDGEHDVGVSYTVALTP